MRPSTLPVLAALSVAVTLSAPGAVALPILDDFETGSFNLQAGPGSPVSVAVAVSSPGNAIAPTRDVTLISGGPGASAAQLDAFFLPDDEVQMVMPSGGGRLELHYAPPAAVDLTDGGQNDRIDVTFTVADPGAQVDLQLTDVSGSGGSASVAVNGPGTHSLFFPAFGSVVDLTQLQQVDLVVTMPQGDFHVSDVRAMRPGALPMKLDASIPSAFGPPYPTGPVTFDVTDDAGGALETLELLLADAHVPPNPCAPPNPCTPDPIQVLGSDSGGGAGVPGTTATAQFLWSDLGVGWSDSFFDIPVTLSAPSPAVSVELPALPALVSTPEGFALSFDVWYRGRTGQVTGTSRRTISFSLPAVQGLEIQDVAVAPPNPISPAGALQGFQVSFNLIQVGSVDLLSPLFEATITGDAQAAVTTAAVPLAVAESGPFRAQPSITRSGTRFVFSRSLESPGRIEVFDVAGRLVRTLDASRGATSIDWDGRARDGRDLPAGVYLARLRDGESSRTARVVRIR